MEDSITDPDLGKCPNCGSTNFIVDEEGHRWLDESGVNDDYRMIEHCLDCGYLYDPLHPPKVPCPQCHGKNTILIEFEDLNMLCCSDCRWEGEVVIPRQSIPLLIEQTPVAVEAPAF